MKRYLKVTVYTDNRGYTSAACTPEKARLLVSKGFRPMMHFRTPARYPYTWDRAYRWLLGWAVHNLGI